MPKLTVPVGSAIEDSSHNRSTDFTGTLPNPMTQPTHPYYHLHDEKPPCHNSALPSTQIGPLRRRPAGTPDRALPPAKTTHSGRPGASMRTSRPNFSRKSSLGSHSRQQQPVARPLGHRTKPPGHRSRQGCHQADPLWEDRPRASLSLHISDPHWE